MNRNGPVPFWLVTVLGVLVISGAYILGQSPALAPEPKLTLERPTVPSQAGLTESASPTDTAGPDFIPLDSVVPEPSATPQVSMLPLIHVDTRKWTTCRNSKYRFEIKFPKDWQIYDPGGGAYRPTTCNNVYFSISRSTIPSEDGMFVTIDDLGASRLAPKEQAATTVQAYLQALRDDGAHLSPLPDEMDIGGQPSFWFQCQGDRTCWTQVYFQHDGQIYEIDVPQSGSDILHSDFPTPGDVTLFGEILATWRFLN